MSNNLFTNANGVNLETNIEKINCQRVKLGRAGGIWGDRCIMCYNSSWTRCFMGLLDKCSKCNICNNKQYIRCYVCKLGIYLKKIDNEPYNSLSYNNFYFYI